MLGSGSGAVLLVFVGAAQLWCCFEMIDAPAQLIEVALFFVLLQIANIVRPTPEMLTSEVALLSLGPNRQWVPLRLLASGLFRVEIFLC